MFIGKNTTTNQHSLVSLLTLCSVGAQKSPPLLYYTSPCSLGVSDLSVLAPARTVVPYILWIHGRRLQWFENYSFSKNHGPPSATTSSKNSNSNKKPNSHCLLIIITTHTLENSGDGGFRPICNSSEVTYLPPPPLFVYHRLALLFHQCCRCLFITIISFTFLLFRFRVCALVHLCF